jgi:hypothetical protein
MQDQIIRDVMFGRYLAAAYSQWLPIISIHSKVYNFSFIKIVQLCTSNNVSCTS